MDSADSSVCAICGSLGAEIANAGRGDYLSDAWYQMRRSDLAHEIDLGRCPECDACFEWTDHPQCYGSGKLDEEHLRRLPEAEAVLVRKLCAPDNVEAPLRIIDAAPPRSPRTCCASSSTSSGWRSSCCCQNSSPSCT